MAADPRTVRDLPTPALVVDAGALERNLAAMADALPGTRCRPHVKAHKTTALAARQRAHGHRTFTAATPREIRTVDEIPRSPGGKLLRRLLPR